MKSYTIQDAPLTWRQWRIVGIAALGQMIGTCLATVVSVIIPLYQIVARPELSSAMQGLVGAMDLIGIMVGSSVIGRLSDRYGYLLFFRLCPLVVCVSALVSVFFPSLPVLIACLFVMGFGIGGEYSLDSDYISVLMPTRWEFTMIGVAKTASALGNIAAAGVCFLMVGGWHDASSWPKLMWILVALSALMFLLRIRFWESPAWLMARGRKAEAEKSVRDFLGNDVAIAPEKAVAAQGNGKPASGMSAWTFLRENWRKVVFTGIPWACEGLGVYGIGVFLPILVMALGLDHLSSDESQLAHVANSVEITLWISCIILPGFVIGLFLIPKMNGAIQQTMGFVMSGAALLLLLFAYKYHWPVWISIVAFMSFELFLNLGPHLMTYVLPPKVYPLAIRGMGTGIAASIGKLGAVLGVFFIPVLLKSGGSVLVLTVSAAVMFAGALVTFLFAPSRTSRRLPVPRQ